MMGTMTMQLPEPIIEIGDITTTPIVTPIDIIELPTEKSDCFRINTENRPCFYVRHTQDECFHVRTYYGDDDTIPLPVPVFPIPLSEWGIGNVLALHCIERVLYVVYFDGDNVLTDPIILKKLSITHSSGGGLESIVGVELSINLTTNYGITPNDQGASNPGKYQMYMYKNSGFESKLMLRSNNNITHCFDPTTLNLVMSISGNVRFIERDKVIVSTSFVPDSCTGAFPDLYCNHYSFLPTNVHANTTIQFPTFDNTPVLDLSIGGRFYFKRLYPDGVFNQGCSASLANGLMQGWDDLGISIFTGMLSVHVADVSRPVIMYSNSNAVACTVSSQTKIFTNPPSEVDFTVSTDQSYSWNEGTVLPFGDSDVTEPYKGVYLCDDNYIYALRVSQDGSQNVWTRLDSVVRSGKTKALTEVVDGNQFISDTIYRYDKTLLTASGGGFGGTICNDMLIYGEETGENGEWFIIQKIFE